MVAACIKKLLRTKQKPNATHLLLPLRLVSFLGPALGKGRTASGLNAWTKVPELGPRLMCVSAPPGASSKHLPPSSGGTA